jgi:hypothetical protein
MAREDDFSAATKRILEERVGHVCSCPDCRAPTSGPRIEEDKSVKAGDAAHITAASPEGPRYDPSLTSAERRHYNNGIWLCVNHARIVDHDKSRYTVEELHGWKQDAEAAALKNLGKPQVPTEGQLGTATLAERLGAETAVLVAGQRIPHTSIFDPDTDGQPPTWFVNGFVVQFGIKKREELSYVVFDFIQATVYETRPIPTYQPLMLVYPAETSLYYIEIADNPPGIPRQFRPTRFYQTTEPHKADLKFPTPLVIDSAVPAQVAVRLNARESGMYLVSLEAIVSSGSQREALTVMQPQYIIFEKYEAETP